jgi:hypothetical protein
MHKQEDVIRHYINKKRKLCYSELLGSYIQVKEFTGDCHVEAWYKEARQLWKIECTYEEFAWLIENERVSPYWRYNGYLREWQKRRPLNENDRGPRKIPNYKGKKVLSEDEQRKREWKKKFRKDKAKRKYWRWCKVAKWVNKYAHKKHRQHTREMIHREKYDELSKKSHREVLKFWYWD